jgi:hypothetical protein
MVSDGSALLGVMVSDGSALLTIVLSLSNLSAKAQDSIPSNVEGSKYD